VIVSAAITSFKTNIETHLQIVCASGFAQVASAGVYLCTNVHFVSFVRSVKLAGQAMAGSVGLIVIWTAGQTMTWAALMQSVGR
jgi:hypothetical protein